MRFIVREVTYGEKDPEFPNGKPIYSYSTYESVTDQNGLYTFNFKAKGNWSYTLSLNSQQYSKKWPAWLGYIAVTGNPNDPLWNWQVDDTTYAEKSGIVKFHIKNENGGFLNDTVMGVSGYSQFWRPSSIYWLSWPELTGYDWGYTGPAIDKIIEKAFPAESEPLVPVKWFHKRVDTLISKTELIQIAPNSTVDYNIYY